MTDKLFPGIKCFVHKQEDDEYTVELQFNFKNEAEALHIAFHLDEFMLRELIAELECSLGAKIEIENVSKASDRIQ